MANSTTPYPAACGADGVHASGGPLHQKIIRCGLLQQNSLPILILLRLNFQLLSVKQRNRSGRQACLIRRGTRPQLTFRGQNHSLSLDRSLLGLSTRARNPKGRRSCWYDFRLRRRDYTYFTRSEKTPITVGIDREGRASLVANKHPALEKAARQTSG